MSYNKEYTVYFEGKVVVEAETEAEATEKAYDTLSEAQGIEFNIKATEEGECAECGGDGEVSCDETDRDGNIERGVGTQKCICRVEAEEDNE